MSFKLRLLCVALVMSLGGFSAMSQTSEYHLKFDTPEELQAFLKFDKKKSIPLISAHRGGPAFGFPENCTQTFANTIKYHPAVIETDIALSKDSVLVMMHDNTLDRTTTGKGRIDNYTFDELRQLKLKDNNGRVTDFKIETLDEVLQWSKGKVILNLDIKRGVPFRMIVDAVRKNKAEAYSVIITYNANQAAEIAALAPELMISVSARGKEDVERLEGMGVKVEKMIAFVGISEPKKPVYDYLHSRGISCILGTMGNLDKSAEANGDVLYYNLVKNGANVLSTDRNQEAGKEIMKYIAEKKLTSKHMVKE
ncbi:glycerophosphodiester phosphodiesterase family protein [Flavobacterium sp. '19STA2R22 D10 B1']|uniref:glycerophosphodiester phosphodiesterase family protein n=1 Tax=Flavobacterium aerium TaxID=3037261 RepID=UPI00278C3312|nr:glycerophosphodiester phosphodiesterase family protein [Flavobacterium sp. '19STA2R22 D10 B1']